MKRISPKPINQKKKSSKDKPTPAQKEYGDILSLSGSIDATPEELARSLFGQPVKRKPKR
ncbi:MAG: hypothetical protein OXF48_01785 [Bacteroidetes bacterium]|nr:hypothetical protein [Bacteroidota bacterium]